MKPLRYPIQSAACVLIGILINTHATHADLITYALKAPTGYGGGTVTGTITFSGNNGDPVPALNAAPSFALTFTPSVGPIETWSQTDSVAVSYNPAVDFGSGLLGDSTLTAATIPSGLDAWTVTNGSLTTLELDWAPSPYGPVWEVLNPSPLDYVYGTWSLDLRSDAATPEPEIAAFVPLLGLILLSRRRSRQGSC
jgi:hypothetical protein